MIINGIELDNLRHSNRPDEPEMVKDRVAQIDGDFLAYIVACKEQPLGDMKEQVDIITESLRRAAGAEYIVIHLTPKESDKGKRYDLALLREYQANRAGKPKPTYLHLIRQYMHEFYGALQHVHCEADDGMSIAQYKAIASGNRNLSIIVTKDKDLAMVPGLALDWTTGEITDTTDDFGSIYLADDKAAKKIKGRGWKLFWAQMLTGDAADNISGLPKVCDPKYLPKGKPKPCGPVFAYEILSPLKTNKEAFQVVKDLYAYYNTEANTKDSTIEPFKNYRDGKLISASQAFVSEAKLLWMRRKLDDNDVIHWLAETCL